MKLVWVFFVFGVKGVTCVCSIRNATFGFTAKEYE